MPQDAPAIISDFLLQHRNGRWEGAEIRFQCPNEAAHKNADEHPSARWRPDKGVWRCDVCASGGGWKSLGEWLDITLPAAGSRTILVKQQITDIFDYLNASGELAYQVVRLEPGRSKAKDFMPRRKVADGKWAYGMKAGKYRSGKAPDGEACWWPGKNGQGTLELSGCTYLLYNLPEVLRAAKAGQAVFLTEGEKDARNLIKLGVVATTNPSGAGKWNQGYTRAFADAKIIYLPDNDTPGRQAVAKIAPDLNGVAAELRILYMPAPHKDVSDWLAAGGTLEELERLVEAAPLAALEAPESAPEESEAAELQRTDLGNAKRLIAAHVEDIRYVHSWKKWLVWHGTHWQLDETDELERRMKAVIERMLAEAETNADHDWAKKSQSRRAIHDALTLARSEAVVSVVAGDLDQGPFVLNLKNGLLDLDTMELSPHRRADLHTKLIGVAYDPTAQAPRWQEFLQRIMGGSQLLIEFLQRAVGYSLSQSVEEQVLFFLYGAGRNGKSTFVNVLMELLGPYAGKTAPDMLMNRRYDAHPTNLADLFGLRVAVANEVQGGRSLNESLIKDLTGGDPITTRRLYENNWTFWPTHKIWMYGNHKPIIRGSDEGIWRRIRLVPFGVQIPEAEVDPKLPHKLREELPGILNWALAGFLGWRTGGLDAPEAVKAATRGYRGEMDIIGSFLEDCCYPRNSTMTASVKSVYDAHVKWCKDSGEEAASKKHFNVQLEERGFSKSKSTGGNLHWLGLGLKDGTEVHEND